MITCRPFLNTDPSALVNVWQQQKRLRGMAQGIDAALLEELVFSRPWFEAAGLHIGFRDGEAAGFSHAGFASLPDGSDLDLATGIISQLRLVNPDGDPELAGTLIEASLDYLRGRGARHCYAGSHFPWSPFYLGIYGGSRVPGVLADDVAMFRPLEAAGFQVTRQVGIFHRELAGYRPLVDRKLISLKRQYDFVTEHDPPPSNWWEACSLGSAWRIRFTLVNHSTQQIMAAVTYWEMQPIAHSWGARAAGMYDLQVTDSARRTGLATCLINESLRSIAQEGIGLVETQTPLDDERTSGCFAKLGFVQTDSAVQMRRPL